MKRSIVLIILILLAFSSFGLAMERHFEYEKAYENDKGIYIYFRVILLYSEMTLDKIIAEDNQSLYYANNVETKLNITREEIEFYRSFGIRAKVEDYLPTFLDLGRGIKKIALGQNLFLENIEKVRETGDYQAYINASLGLETMGEGISKAEGALNNIENFEFVDEDNSTLRLDTSSLREKLEKIKEMYSGYERVLSTYTVLPPDSFLLYASNLNPFVQENVTFYGYAPNFTIVNLHIGNLTVVLNVKNDRFSFVYSFDRIGNYEVFATGIRNGSFEKSNTLNISVLRIPTRIILSSGESAYINQSVNVRGVLLDYYGNALGGEELFVEYDQGKFRVSTLENGAFSFNVTARESGKKLLNVSYAGSDVYAGSSAFLSLTFLKYPVRIEIKTDKESFKVGEEVKIRGTVSGVRREIPVIVYVDGKPHTEVHTMGDFEVDVVFNETGEHKIYALFPGDEYYERAISNTITLKIVSFSLFETFLIILIVALLFGIAFLGYRLYRRGHRGMSDEEFVALLKAMEEAKKDKDVRKFRSLREMYREIYHKLIRHYGLKTSLTPRELVSRLKGESFAYHLEKITTIYERHFYGKKILRRSEVLEYLRHVAGFIVSFIVGEEL